MEIDIQTIEGYLSGDLSPQDKATFENQVATDPALKDKVAQHLTLLQSFEQVRLEQAEKQFATNEELLNLDTKKLIPWRFILFILLFLILYWGLSYISNEVYLKRVPTNPQQTIQQAPQKSPDTNATAPVQIPESKSPPMAAQGIKIGQKEADGIALIEKIDQVLDPAAYAGGGDDTSIEPLNNGRKQLLRSIQNSSISKEVNSVYYKNAIRYFDIVITGLENSSEEDEIILLYRAKYYKGIALSITDRTTSKKLLLEVSQKSPEGYLQAAAAAALSKI